MARTSTTTRINQHTLRVLRERSGLTTRQLSERSGVSHAYITQIEAGDRMPSPKIIRALADGLSVPMVVLLAGEDDE